MIRSAAAAALCLVGAGCDRSATPPVSASVTTDSAGVAIVTSTMPAWPDGADWTVDTIPELEIGGATTLPAVLLVGVTAVRQVNRDELVVTSAADRRVRWFDRRGSLLREAGGDGTGPGRFRDIELAGTIGDTLVLWDGSLERITVMAGDGSVARVVSLEIPASTGVTDAAATGVFRDGRLLVAGRSRTLSTMPSALRRDTIPLASVDADGRFVQLIAEVPGHENVVVTGPGFVTMLPRPFGARTLVATDDTTLLVTVGDVDAVTRYAADGSVIASYRLDRPRRLISQVEIERQRQRLEVQVEQLPEPVDQAVADAMAGVAVPRVYPAHDRMIVDATGAIWLREDIGPGRGQQEHRRWTVLDADGRWLGYVVTPRRTEVHQITRDRIIGVWRDDNDVEHVRVHALDR